MMVRRQSVAFMALLLGALVLAACGIDGEQRGPASTWGRGAEEWLANVQEAGREGVPNLEAFLTADVVLDHRGTGGEVAKGVGQSLSLVRHLEYTQPRTRLRPPPYLSRGGMVVPAVWEGPDLLTVQDAVLVMTLSPLGLVREETASALVSGHNLVDPGRDWASLEALADRYVEDHTTADVTTTLDAIPARGGPAVFGIPRLRSDDGFRRVIMLLTSEDDAGCPGRIAVALSLAKDGAVLREQRYLRLDDARRCLDANAALTGWWTAMDVPEPVQLERTGTVVADGATVEIWNGTPALESLVEWGMGRYAEAGLRVPRPRSVTFYPAADRCEGNLAVAGGESNDEIVVCFGEGLACRTSPCPPWSAMAEATTLHELAHTWMAQNLTEETRAAYEDLVSLSWASPRDAWEDRAIERAAEVIAWGLLQRPSPPQEFAATRSELDREFRLLTGTPPASAR